jgi:DNA-binding NtrC family response regulator
MLKGTLVINSDQIKARELSEWIEKVHYPATAMDSIQNLESRLAEKKFLAVIIDIDTVAIDNRTIRDLALKFPGIRFLCTSKDRFHPELKDAIGNHIYACLKKPVDPDELMFWIKSIYEEERVPDT